MYVQNLLEIAPNTAYNARFSAFESFLSDGGVNEPDMYLCRETEDFTPEFDRAVMSGAEKYAETADTDCRVINVPEFDYMLTA
ncbi:MAG: hypothetical protein J1E96_05400 [Ruminococcus sp.]|nr:hypothetical protein [Ruminococcus sp.]